MLNERCPKRSLPLMAFLKVKAMKRDEKIKSVHGTQTVFVQCIEFPTFTLLEFNKHLWMAASLRRTWTVWAKKNAKGSVTSVCSVGVAGLSISTLYRPDTVDL